MTEHRIERDSMGEVRVPAAAKWGAQTQRAVANFPISGTTVDPSLVRALGAIKAAAALENGRLKVIERAVAEAIAAAADEVAEGRWDDQFPIDVFQTGSGTSTNMNANEVIATLASERLGRRVHPNDHVNASQSSNDVFPSAIHVAAVAGITGDLVPALSHLGAGLRGKARQFRGVVKAGRTHLMDATRSPSGRSSGATPRRWTTPSSGCRRACPGWPSSPSGVRRSAPGSMPRRGSPAGSWPGWRSEPGCRSPRPATTSRPRAAATRWSRRRG